MRFTKTHIGYGPNQLYIGIYTNTSSVTIMTFLNAFMYMVYVFFLGIWQFILSVFFFDLSSFSDIKGKRSVWSDSLIFDVFKCILSHLP